MEHLFRDCYVARRIWACTELGIRVGEGESLGLGKWIINWVNYLGKLHDADIRIVLFMATIWVISLKLSPQKSEILATLELDDERMQWIRESKSIHLVMSPNACDRLRLMVDAGRKSREIAGIGWVVLSPVGNILFETGKFIRAESPLQAEALGLREVLSWAVKHNILHLEVFSDCLPIVTAIADIVKPHHLVKALLNDILSLCSSFHCLSFSYVPRVFNKIAHGLACKAMNS
ncbi:uncharacterized protein LOC141630386 [Silene latifolia]|uniref:uncharacterized protein LOC141630386 n=1 Tax=Silene latifolia TaxID=37657 RepID=UPI003D770EE4